MISWETAFDTGDQAWLILTCVITIALGPAGIFVFLFPRLGQDQRRDLLKSLPLLIASLLLSWSLWGYTLAYAPSWHTVPEAAPIAAQPLTTLEAEMALAEARADETQKIGRGGVIGGFDYIAMNMVIPIMGDDGPLFPRRRPHEHIPHVLEFLFHTCGLTMILPALWCLWGPQLGIARAVIMSLLWITLVYAPVAHSLSGDGWLELMGAIDFGGGVLFIALGSSAFACVVPKRDQQNSTNGEWQESVGAIAIWLAVAVWVSAHTFHADQRIGLAFTNMLLGTASSVAIWGIANSFVWKLETATQIPASVLIGVTALSSGGPWLQPQSAIIAGTCAGLFTNVVFQVCGMLQQSSLRSHLLAFLLGGTFGMLATGVVASKAIAGSRWDGREISGLIDGDVSLVGYQLIAVAAAAGWSFILSWLIYRGVMLTYRWLNGNE